MRHMKILLPGFAILLGMLLALFGTATDGEDVAASVPLAPLAPLRERQVPNSSEVIQVAFSSPIPQTPAQRILERTRDELDRLPHFSARVRYRVALFDQELIGAGTYFQSGVGQQKKLRY